MNASLILLQFLNRILHQKNNTNKLPAYTIKYVHINLKNT